MIPKETAETLKLKDPITPKFYMLLIIHKINNPGRPVLVLLDAIVRYGIRSGMEKVEWQKDMKAIVVKC